VIVTASTVKTSPEQLEQFVDRNLAAGVDHMVVFLDAPMPEAGDILDPNPCVTTVAAYDDYWGSWRPPSLNPRQTINANLTRLLLTPLPWAQWLFHIDSDECLDIDKDHLVSLGPSVTSVQLGVLEKVSTLEETPEELFKRALSEPELALLHLLGVIDQPENRALFNGYVHGKAGIRPALDRQLHIHRAKDLNLKALASYQHDSLRVLHYDSVSLADFRRKWAVHHGPSAVATYGARKDQLRSALGCLLDNAKLDEDQKTRYVTRLYQASVEDDVALLDELGFLERVDETRHRHTPQQLTDGQRADLEALLPLLVRAHKDHYRLRPPRGAPWALYRSLSRQLRPSSPGLADALDRCAAVRPNPPRDGPARVRRSLVRRGARTVRSVPPRLRAVGRR
jgi:hypothetical protein